MPIFEVSSETKSRKAVAVRFSNGVLNSKDESRVKFKCFTQEVAASKLAAPRHIVTADVDGMSYIGKTFGPTNRFPTDNCDYYFGIHDKKTGKIRVISAEICQLEPVLEGKRHIDDVDSNQKTYRDKVDALATDFGSGRSQRAVNRRLNNKLDNEVVSVATKAVIDSSHTQQQAAETAEPVITETSAVPPHNKDAVIPDDVYKLQDIIPPEVMDALSFKSDIFFRSTLEDVARWRAEKKYSTFVLDKLETLAFREDARKLQSKCLMYLDLLMKMYLMKAKELNRKIPLPETWPVPVKKHVLKMFTLEISQPGKKYQRCTPCRLKDLHLSHILVLCLKLSQYDLVLTSLMNDLNLSQKRITTHATILGCSVKKVKDPNGQDVHKALLTVPLKFPKIKGKVKNIKIF